MKALSPELMKQAIARLDLILDRHVRLIAGGGGAMVLAHGFPLATSDIDAVPLGMELVELDSFIKQVAKELELPADWLNPYFSAF